MTKNSIEERMAIVETKLDIVIEQQKKLVDKFDDLLLSYVPRTEYEETIKGLEAKIALAQKRTALQTWLTGTLSAIFGAVLATLVKSFFGI